MLAVQISVFAAPGRGFAAGNTRILILQTQPSAAPLAQRIQASLSEEEIETLSPSNLSARNDSREIRDPQVGERFYKKALVDYRRLEFRGAIQNANKAQKNASLSVLKQVFLLKAQAYFAMKNIALTKKSLVNYANLNGEPLDDAVHSPSFVSLYQEASQWVKSNRNLTVEVKPSLVVGDRFWVLWNGERLRSTTVRTTPGYHFVQIVAAAHDRFESLVYVKPQSTQISPKLTIKSNLELVRAVSQTNVPGEKESALEVLQKEAEAGAVLVVGENTLDLFQNGQRKWSRSFQLQEPISPRDVRAIAALVGKPNLQINAEEYASLDVNPRSSSADRKKGSAWYSKWWVWSLVGAAAIGAGGFVYMQGRDTGSSDTIQLTVEGR